MKSYPKQRFCVALSALSAIALGMTGCAGGALSSGGGGNGSAETVTAGIETSDCPADFNSVGITDDTVRIGASSPKSGPGANSYSLGVDAYVEMQNTAGGFAFGDGKTRMVKNVVYDDARETSRTRTNVERLVHEDKVFALVGISGTAANLAARPIVDENCIPSLYMESGNNEMGNPEFPWSVAPILPANAVEAKVALKLITDARPDAKVAALVQNDSSGKSLLSTFKRGLEGTHATLVAEATFEPTDTAVSAQITTLANSGATDFVMLSGNGTFQLQALEAVAQSNWNPGIKFATFFRPSQLAAVSERAREGVHMSTWVKDPGNKAVVAGSDELQLFLKWFNKQPGASSYDPTIAQFGWMAMRFLSENFKEMKEPTRTALIEAARSLSWDGESLYSDGIKYSINWPENPYGIQALMVLAYDPLAGAGPIYKELGVVDMSGKITYVKGN